MKKLSTALIMTLAPAIAGLAVFARNCNGQGLPYEPRSENTAFWLSLSGTVVPLAAGITMASMDGFEGPDAALIAWGGLVGPSLGYFYGGESKRGLTGIAIRCGLVLITIAGAATEAEITLGDDEETTYPVALIGPILFVADMVVDIAHTKKTISEHNSRLAQKSLTLAPVYFAESKTVGLGLRITF